MMNPTDAQKAVRRQEDAMNGGLRQGERSMDIQQIFRILGISETKEEERIKEAYRGRLTGVNPEDNAHVR